MTNSKVTKQFDEVLGLKEKGLHAVVLLSFGLSRYRNDYLVNLPKVRLPMDEFAAFAG